MDQGVDKKKQVKKMQHYFSALTLDDLLRDVLTALVSLPANIEATRGKTSEIAGALLRLENPRARLSRTETRGKPFSALGELLWYLSKTHSLKFISYYLSRYEDESDDGKTVYGGYGPRLFNMRGKHDQVSNVIQLLKKKPTSRRAVIQLFNAEDLVGKHKEIPCTCTLQFMIRKNRLEMFTSMRSNDAFWGLPHDVFSFTMLQEIVARALSVELGAYSHAVGSLHLYKDKFKLARQYLSEGWQSTEKPMPKMSNSNPMRAISNLLKAEAAIRNGDDKKISRIELDSYWSDLVNLLQIHKIFKKEILEAHDFEKVKRLRRSMSSGIYHTYIDHRLILRETDL